MSHEGGHGGGSEEERVVQALEEDSRSTFKVLMIPMTIGILGFFASLWAFAGDQSTSIIDPLIPEKDDGGGGHH